MTEVKFKSLEIKSETRRKSCFLKVTGALYVKETLANIQLEKAVPQGVNPKELILEFRFDAKKPVSRDAYNPFHYSSLLADCDQFTSIRLIYDGWISESFDVKR